MLIVFFKVSRRVSKLLTFVTRWSRLVGFKVLYKDRFLIEKAFKAGKQFNLEFDLSASKIIIRNGTEFRDGCIIRSGLNGNLTIGKNVFFNNNCSLNCFGVISIGDDCLFGERVSIYDHNHRFRSKVKKIQNQGYSTGSIQIGRNCWIGTGSIILKGAIVGDNVIIGAGCIIRENIPSNSIVTNQDNILINHY